MTAKSTRKAHPASVRKQAAAAAYKQTFGRDPVGRYTAAGLERRVANAQAQHRRLDAMDRYFKTDPLSAGPAQSSKPLTTWDAVVGNTHGEPVRNTSMTMPSRLPAAGPAQPQSTWSRASETVKGWAKSPEPDTSRYLDDAPVRDMRSKLTKGLLGVGVGVAAVQGYRQARDDGSSVAGAAVKGAVHALPQAAGEMRPQVALRMGETLNQRLRSTGKLKDDEIQKAIDKASPAAAKRVMEMSTEKFANTGARETEIGKILEEELRGTEAGNTPLYLID
jgi:hypothetical protein